MSLKENLIPDNEENNTEEYFPTDDGGTTTSEEYKISAFDPSNDISDPKVIETWVDNILKDAESLEDYHKYLK